MFIRALCRCLCYTTYYFSVEFIMRLGYHVHTFPARMLSFPLIIYSFIVIVCSVDLLLLLLAVSIIISHLIVIILNLIFTSHLIQLQPKIVTKSMSYA